MDNNYINNHICKNTNKRMDRNYTGRVENEITPRKDDNYYGDADEDKLYCDICKHKCENEHGGEVYYLDVQKNANQNNNFRESVWTGKYLQMTLMSIPRNSDIGVEMHKDTDQYIRIEHGYAILVTGDDANRLENKKKLFTKDAVFIPAGTWHNIINIGRCDLKISSIYAPPHHPRCTVQKNK